MLVASTGRLLATSNQQLATHFFAVSAIRPPTAPFFFGSTPPSSSCGRAITCDENTKQEIEEKTQRLVKELLTRNELEHDDIVSVVFTATDDLTAEFPAAAARGVGLGDIPLLCARELAIDHGMLLLNSVFGGTVYLDVARELPDALQHRHPPEKGLRHAIMVERGSLLADIYGEGEVVVSSEHRRAVNRVARGLLAPSAVPRNYDRGSVP